jgi:hypothetical protein
VNDLVYLDVCCFKRPFDDATDARVQREAATVRVPATAAAAAVLGPDRVVAGMQGDQV